MQTNQLSVRSLPFWLSFLVAIAIIFIGIRFILAPQVGGAGYGIPLTQDLWYGRVKGIRDVVSGLLVLGMLWHRDRTATGIVMGIATFVPLGDLMLILARNGSTDVEHILVHGLTVVYMLVVTRLLFRNAQQLKRTKTS